MKHRQRSFSSFLFLLLFTFICVSVQAQTVEQIITEGDEYAEKKFDNGKALEIYLKGLKNSTGNHDLLWRISRAYVDIGEHLPDKTDEQKDEQLKTFQQALDYANQAIKANPHSSMGFLRRAIANGKIALFKGVFSVIGLVKDVRADLEKAIQLKTADEHQTAVAHYVLGRTHAKVCEKPYLVRLPLGLGWGDREISADEYEKAIALRPNFIMFRLDAAKNYVEMDEYQKAKEHLYKIPHLAKNDEDDERFKTEAATLLNEIKNK